MVDLMPVNTTYEPFSREPEYVEANRGFVERQNLGHVGRFLDLACGAGTVSELLLEKSPRAHLNGVDYDPVQVQLSCEHFNALGFETRRGFELTEDCVGGKPVLVFGEGSATELPFPAETFDCVTIANAIHLIDDKPGLIASVQRLLKPGGVFGFNTTFYSGSLPAGSEKMYMDWLQRAAAHIEGKNRELAAAGKPIVRRERGTTRRAFANRWFSVAEWTDLLAQHGLKAVDVYERRVELSERAFTYVGAYGGLAQVLLSGFPVEVASEALQAAAVPAMRAAGAKTAPRFYLEFWAQKA
jgi:ubiquinone/menaquinone biosynthesis C-methylase UbiE